MNRYLKITLLTLFIYSGCAAPAPVISPEADGAPPVSGTIPDDGGTAVACIVPNQVLVTGHIDDVGRIAGANNLTRVEGFEPLSFNVFANYFNEYAGGEAIEEANLRLSPTFPPDRFNSLIIDLYQFDTPDVDIQTTLQRIAEMGQSEQDEPVRFDPNYVLGLVDASDWVILISPSTDQRVEVDQSQFLRQWAFRAIDHFPLVDDQTLSSLSEEGTPTGAGVRMGIFDTSPLVDIADGATVVRSFADIVASSVALDINVFEDSFLTIHQRPLQVEFLPPSPTDPMVANVRDHGLFVAGLVKGVAPRAEIELFRVLDEYGRGDLGTLNSALHAFLSESVGRQTQETGEVINLSLGIPYRCFEQALQTSSGFLSDIISLRELLNIADRLAIPVVAAAGNAGNGTPQEIPARWGNVIGVGASFINSEPACFSNQFNLLAPGGGLDGSCDPASFAAALPNRCGDSSECPYALVSLASDSSTGFAYWAGTSFATPLVSGLAALVHDVVNPQWALGTAHAQQEYAQRSQSVATASWMWPTRTIFDTLRCSTVPDKPRDPLDVPGGPIDLDSDGIADNEDIIDVQLAIDSASCPEGWSGSLTATLRQESADSPIYVATLVDPLELAGRGPSHVTSLSYRDATGKVCYFHPAFPPEDSGGCLADFQIVQQQYMAEPMLVEGDWTVVTAEPLSATLPIVVAWSEAP